MTRWINTPCTDPAGRVFIANERVYRAIFPDQEDAVRSVIENREIAALMDDGLIARMRVSDRKVEGFGMVVEAEKAPFDVPCERFTRATLRTATLRWLEIYRRLLPLGLVLLDAHFGNFMLYGLSEPRWVDLGSIQPLPFVEDEKPFRSFKRFWNGMLAPLALIETQPRHTRLARLSMADQAYQGPLTTVDEAPLPVDTLVEDLHKQVVSEIGALDAQRALDRLSAFTAQLPNNEEGDARRRQENPATAIVKHVGELLASGRARSVICLGADAFRQLSGSWGGADVLVIDEHESDLDRLRKVTERRQGSGQLALCYGHPVNRLFLKNAPSADAVIAIDPLARYAHRSHVELENLSHIIGSLGSRLAVILTAPEMRARTEQMLRQGYPSVSTENFSWFGNGPTVVVGKK
jgi:hypothetical protein